MYNHTVIEKKWQKYWEEFHTFKTDIWDFKKPKYYCLDMFPYPSAQGLHVGHPEGYTATDIIARMKRMQGYNVLHPMGWDAFGLPAEQYAIKTGNHPDEFTKNNIQIFKQQLIELGLSFDWSKEISTADPSYYKWTQWIFKQLFNKGLALLVNMPVNWCEQLGTVLANDEVIDGKSERGGYPVVRKNMKQWVIDIPKYADKLLDNLTDLDWPESTKEIQKNWIGKSVGAIVRFNIDASKLSFNVFTTRCDTLFGVTYCVLSPEHILVDTITTCEYKTEVNLYKKNCASKSDLERTELNKEKTGVFTGSYAINPVNNKKIPIWISDYVLASYGTGAIMAVPAHDERDHAFSKKFKLDIVPVIAQETKHLTTESYNTDGPHINSEFLNGLYKEEAITKMLNWLEENKVGFKKTNYRLREWIFARQRYWGEPIPIIHLKDKDIALDDKDLPLILPILADYKPAGSVSPLAKAKTWVNVNVNGEIGQRETSTMPGSAGSSWYFMRYIDPTNSQIFANKELLNHWLPVDLYVGGPEHAVGHLLYSRFWTNFLHDEGYLNHQEPFHKLRHQGMILGENNEKMSKSKGNVVNPDDIVTKYGADSLRVYEMFMGPLEATKPWDETGVLGSRRFLERIYRLYIDENKINNQANPRLEKEFHKTVKKVTDDYEALSFNTAISQMMIFINSVYKEDIFPKTYAMDFLKLLNPIAPHITEELWQNLGNKNTISYEPWPQYNDKLIVDETFTMIVQINGKVRGKLEVKTNTTPEEMKQLALNIENVKKYLETTTIEKIVAIPNKLVSIVIKQ